MNIGWEKKETFLKKKSHKLPVKQCTCHRHTPHWRQTDLEQQPGGCSTRGSRRPHLLPEHQVERQVFKGPLVPEIWIFKHQKHQSHMLQDQDRIRNRRGLPSPFTASKTVLCLSLPIQLLITHRGPWRDSCEQNGQSPWPQRAFLHRSCDIIQRRVGNYPVGRQYPHFSKASWRRCWAEWFSESGGHVNSQRLCQNAEGWAPAQSC